MSDTTSLVLTDDELVGVAHLSGQPWMRPLATVDLHDPEHIVAAVGRGLRSLSLRGLLDDEGGLSTATGPAIGLCAGRVRLAATWVDPDFIQLADAKRFELVEGSSGDWYAVSVAPGGVHAVAAAAVEDVVTFFADLAAAASLDPELPQFCVVARSGPAFCEGLVCEGGSIRRLVLDADGEIARAEELAPACASDWVALVRRMLGQATTGAR